MKTYVLILCVAVCLPVCCSGTVIHVPGDHPTIQAGIGASADGDTVLVEDGIYVGEGNKNIDFQGKVITLMSRNGPEKCVINCEGDGRGIVFTSNATLKGMTITGGCINAPGGGILISMSSPTIINCKVISCETYGGLYIGRGGGIYIDEGDILIKNCEISHCSTTSDGGGMFCLRSTGTILGCDFFENSSHSGGGLYIHYSQMDVIDCLFEANSATTGSCGGLYISTYNGQILNCLIKDNTSDNSVAGLEIHGYEISIINCLIVGNRVLSEDSRFVGGMAISGSRGEITNCTFSGNQCEGGTGAIKFYDSTIAVNNCIMWDDSLPEITASSSSPTQPVSPNIDYCNIKGGYYGEGNIDADPLFTSINSDHYYLSQIDAGQSGDSPCINTGDQSSDLICYWKFLAQICMSNLTTRIDSITDEGTVNMGFHYLPGVLTPTPHPTPDQPPCPALGVKIKMPSNNFQPDDLCNCHAILCNPDATTYFNTPLFVILDLFGNLFFAPDFSDFDFLEIDLSPGVSIIEILPDFQWPAGAGNASGVFWYAGMTTPEMNALFGAMDIFEFGWSD